MNSRVDEHLVLRPNRKVIEVTGPIDAWDAYEVSAKFTVVIAQVKPTGKVVLARGTASRTYRPGDTSWRAIAGVEDESTQLIDGEATAFALAAVKLTNGEFEPYPWSVPTNLDTAGVEAVAAT